MYNYCLFPLTSEVTNNESPGSMTAAVQLSSNTWLGEWKASQWFISKSFIACPPLALLLLLLDSYSYGIG